MHFWITLIVLHHFNFFLAIVVFFFAFIFSLHIFKGYRTKCMKYFPKCDDNKISLTLIKYKIGEKSLGDNGGFGWFSFCFIVSWLSWELRLDVFPGSWQHLDHQQRMQQSIPIDHFRGRDDLPEIMMKQICVKSNVSSWILRVKLRKYLNKISQNLSFLPCA